MLCNSARGFVGSLPQPLRGDIASTQQATIVERGPLRRIRALLWTTCSFRLYYEDETTFLQLPPERTAQ